MTLDLLFTLANQSALLSWAALVLLPRWRWLTEGIRWTVLLALSALYAVLIAVFFFRVEGGGFFSLAQVQILFTSREVALAGWVHYLAFDLFVGLWIARRADDIGLSRIVQAPILVATFMFGPLGFLLFHGVLALRAARALPAAARA
jgi:hypothetical protein